MKIVTVNNLDESTQQEVFDFIVNHLTKQGKQALGYDKLCKYRLEKDGEVLKCAAGCLIPDEKYNPKFESSAWWKVAEMGGFSEKHKAFIGRMQIVHDCNSVLEWPERFASIAKEYDLKYTI